MTVGEVAEQAHEIVELDGRGAEKESELRYNPSLFGTLWSHFALSPLGSPWRRCALALNFLRPFLTALSFHAHFGPFSSSDDTILTFSLATFKTLEIGLKWSDSDV